MSEEHDMQFDNLHTLENFLDIYNNSGEMVVTEAIANSLDVNADKIDIKIKSMIPLIVSINKNEL